MQCNIKNKGLFVKYGKISKNESEKKNFLKLINASTGNINIDTQ